MRPSPLHATAVAQATPEGWRAVLLRGASGVGKSDMALRLMACGWRLVADDYVEIWRSGSDLYATSPIGIAGLIEVRGLGILSSPTRGLAQIALLVDCVQTAVERLPEPASETVLDVRLPRLMLDIRAASAATALALAMERL